MLNYNGAEVLERCLKSVLATAYANIEILVVDNASTDESPRIAKKFAQADNRIRTICNSTNLGFVGGNNIGALAARGKYVVLLNNDTEVLPNWLEEPIRLMESDPQIGLCEGKILTSDSRVSYPGLFNPLGNLRRDAEPDEGQYNRVHEIFAPIGVAPIVRRELVEVIDLFDPKIWWVGDVEDLSWRIHLHGCRVMYSPQCVVYHLARLGHKWYPKQMRLEVAFHSTKNSYLILLKNASRRTLFKYLSVLTVMKGGELLYLCTRQKKDLFVAKIRGNIWVLRNARYIWKSRSRIQHEIRRVNDDTIFKLACKPYLSETLNAYRRLVKSF